MAQNTNPLARMGLYVRLEAKPGKESALAELLAGALAIAHEEGATTTWFAVRFGPSSFAVFDSFADENGRQAHLTGRIAAALMANAEALLESPPNIEKWDALAVKLPR